jgi:hypothetical protein
MPVKELADFWRDDALTYRQRVHRHFYSIACITWNSQTLALRLEVQTWKPIMISRLYSDLSMRSVVSPHQLPATPSCANTV